MKFYTFDQQLVEIGHILPRSINMQNCESGYYYDEWLVNFNSDSPAGKIHAFYNVYQVCENESVIAHAYVAVIINANELITQWYDNFELTVNVDNYIPVSETWYTSLFVKLKIEIREALQQLKGILL